MSKVIKVRDNEGKKLLNREESENLRDNIVVLDPENSEIAETLKNNRKRKLCNEKLKWKT